MAGPADSKTWVGLPLVVHRRCDKPMHGLANRIAYDGAMVYGTIAPRADKETRARSPTGWIHASGTSDGNWVPAEGNALRALLALMCEDGVNADISVITPFKAVQENLKRLLGDTMVSGTIHTMQGKEAPVVIMVLGGNTEGPGARPRSRAQPAERGGNAGEAALLCDRRPQRLAEPRLVLRCYGSLCRSSVFPNAKRC